MHRIFSENYFLYSNCIRNVLQKYLKIIFYNNIMFLDYKH